jgi:hypothetical protein
MDTIRRYSMLIGGAWVDLSGGLDRRAYPPLLGTRPT